MSCVLGGGGGLPKLRMYRLDVGEVGSIRNVLEIRYFNATALHFPNSYGTSQVSGILYILPAIIFDAIVGAFLTFGLYRRSRLYRTIMPLVRLIIRDGLLYFFVVFVTNIGWIVVHALEVDKASRLDLSSCICILITGIIQGNISIEFMPLEMWVAFPSYIHIKR